MPATSAKSLRYVRICIRLLKNCSSASNSGLYTHFAYWASPSDSPMYKALNSEAVTGPSARRSRIRSTNLARSMFDLMIFFFSTLYCTANRI